MKWQTIKHFILGENDVEYAEFSMAQRMLLRERSPSISNSTFGGGTSNSFEEKLMLFQLFDRHERASNCLSPTGGASTSSLFGTSAPAECKSNINSFRRSSF